jgi:hypothetical protein
VWAPELYCFCSTPDCFAFRWSCPSITPQFPPGWNEYTAATLNEIILVEHLQQWLGEMHTTACSHGTKWSDQLYLVRNILFHFGLSPLLHNLWNTLCSHFLFFKKKKTKKPLKFPGFLEASSVTSAGRHSYTHSIHGSPCPVQYWVAFPFLMLLVWVIYLFEV